MQNCVNLIALVLTFAGASLLFFYGFPSKKYGNVIFYGNLALDAEPIAGERKVPESEWGPAFTRFQRRTKLFNRVGFALIALGTALQIIALLHGA